MGGVVRHSLGCSGSIDVQARETVDSPMEPTFFLFMIACSQNIYIRISTLSNCMCQVKENAVKKRECATMEPGRYLGRYRQHENIAIQIGTHQMHTLIARSSHIKTAYQL